jgi:hypothetical protein
MRRGLIDADLGGGLLKKRLARAGQGKRGGFRGLVATNRGSRWVFLYLFAKSARDNIDAREEEALKKLSAELVALNEAAIAAAIAAGALEEIDYA